MVDLSDATKENQIVSEVNIGALMEIPRAPGCGHTPPSASEVGQEDKNFHEGIIGEFQQSLAC